MTHSSLVSMCRFAPALVVASSLLLVLSWTSVSSAFVTGSIPSSENCKLQNKVAKKAGKAIGGAGKCYVKAAKALCNGDDLESLTDDLEECKAKVRGKWIDATDKIKEKNPDAPSCLTGADVGQVFDDLDTVLQRSANLIACEGVGPLVDQLTGHKPSDCETIGKAELKVLKQVKKLARKLSFKCLHTLCKKRQDGESFDLAECVDLSKSKFLEKTATVKNVPQCLLDNAPVIADALEVLLSADAGVLFCESGASIDPSGSAGGCCQGDGFCTPAVSPADCDVGFVAQGTCNETLLGCVPPSCGIVDHLTCNAGAGDSCFTCELDCCPAPVCGNGICEAGENVTSCSPDCRLT